MNIKNFIIQIDFLSSFIILGKEMRLTALKFTILLF